MSEPNVFFGWKADTRRGPKPIRGLLITYVRPKKRAERRKQHTAEIEASQDDLRKSIAETERLVGESDEMLRRHRRECEEDDA